MTSLRSSQRCLRLTGTGMGMVLLVALGASHAEAASKSAKKSPKEVESIEEYLGFGTSGGADQQKRITRKVNESIQKCMKAEGFDYKIPPDNAAQLNPGSDTASQSEYVKKFGYGISTSLDVNATSIGGADPNVAILNKLSAADKKAYQTALVGKSTGVAPDPKSCVAKSLTFLGDIVKIQSLFSKYDSNVTKRIESKPEVVAAMKKWSSCMKDKGFSYAKDSEPSADIAKRLGALTGSSAGPGAAIFGANDTGKKFDNDALRKLQKDEIAVATVDFECSQKHLAVRKTLKRDLDRGFIEANQGAIDSFRDSLNG